VESFGLDFGLVIAYLVPGLITLKGVSYRSSHVADLFSSLHGEKGNALTLSLLLLLAIPAGVVTGVVRGVLLDRSYSVGLDPQSRPHWLEEHWGPIPKVKIRYDKLAKEANLSAYREAKVDLLRPAEFYSNTLVALLILMVCRFKKLLPTLPKRQRTSILREATAWAVAIWSLGVLYSGARWSMSRFAEAVNAINQL
jgi:hypothetical protein